MAMEGCKTVYIMQKEALKTKYVTAKGEEEEAKEEEGKEEAEE
jgi:hypothetical protein